MSRVLNAATGRWTTDLPFFACKFLQYGQQSVRHGRTFGATHASALLGPDTQGVNGFQFHPPSVGGPPWDQLFPAPPAPPPVLPPPPNAAFPPWTAPLVKFTEDGRFTWIRGHLIAGEWRGTGGSWTNLVPMTSVANKNHATVEAFIKTFLNNSHAYEEGNRPDWFGVFYHVQCSVAPFADHQTDAPSNLYSYTPAFIKVTWRGVRVSKPTNINNPQPGNLGILPLLPVQIFPFNLPASLPAGALPANNMTGGPVFRAAPPNFPARQNNQFDGDIEIHQT
jgi:hypothetical protein